MKLCPRCEDSFADDAAYCPFDGESLSKAADSLLGRTLGARYRLVRRIGSGGMAVVYLARHVMIERRSAVKILRQELGLNPAHRERFLREARAVNRINHPNIVQITDFGEDAGVVFLVMELVAGEALAAAVAAGPMSWSRAARVASQVAAALARAHQLGVIHRDLKPENILLAQREGEEIVKLTDFGIAKIVDAPSLTFSEQRFGTPGYIAPEYLDGAAASAAGDLYALGVVFYQMLTGALPYDARLPSELLVLPSREDPVPPSRRTPGIPPDIEDLALRLIARRPELRPADALAVHDALEALLVRGGASRASTVAQSEGSEQTLPGAGRPLARWLARAAELGRRVDAEAALRPGDARVRAARDLVEVALALGASLERAAATVAQHQERVDGIEAEGRSFQATLGRAIDALSRDRTRSAAHLAATVARRAQIEREAFVASPEARRRDSFAWALTAAAADETRARAADLDLAYQLDTLERQLETRNERLETERTGATARLEGSLSAVRRITRELGKTLDEAQSALLA